MNTQRKILIGIIIILTFAIILALVLGISGHRNRAQEAVPVSSGSSDEPREVPRLIHVEREITAEIIQEGLRDMGFLVTQEYDCTIVLNNSKARKIFNFQLPFTESSYIVSYDALVEAGIDFTKVTVEKDDDAKIITIHLPDAEIKSIAVDHSSFTLYSEKDGLGTSMSVADYNDSLVECENTAKNKALEKGVLEKASANAELVLLNFVRSMVDTTQYRISIE